MIILNTKIEKLTVLIISITLIVYSVCYHVRFSVFETSKEDQNKSMRYSNKTLKISLQSHNEKKYEYAFQKNSDNTLFKVRERREDVKKSLNPIQVPNRFETQTSFERNPQTYYEEQMPVVVHAESDQSENDEEDDLMNEKLDYYSDQESQYNPQYYENPESIEKEDSFQMRLPEEEEQEHQSAEVFKGPLSDYYDSYFIKEPSSKYEKPTDSKTSSGQQNDDSLYPIQNVYRIPTVTRIAATPTQVNIKESSGIKTVFEKLKTLWNLYRVFTKAWNVLADYRLTSQAKQEQKQQEQKQKQEQKEQQQKQQQHYHNQKQQQDSHPFFNPQTKVRMDNPSKISSAFETYNNSSSAKTTTSKSTELPTLLNKVNSDLSKILKGDPGRKNRRTREQRRSNKETTLETDNQMIAAEGRYIKGDPLKGYYDFVLTEGSYKFWAVFQLGTAILIIYSTFAAIYYTKINPFVADYDYHDYLGGNPGARSFSGDVDFDDDDGGGDDGGDDDGNDDDDNDDDDDDDAAAKEAGRRSGLNLRNWVPKMRHSVKFILEAIDKIPVDHEEGEKEKEE